jgi:hypothetical protein
LETSPANGNRHRTPSGGLINTQHRENVEIHDMGIAARSQNDHVRPASLTPFRRLDALWRLVVIAAREYANPFVADLIHEPMFIVNARRPASS